MKVYSTYLFDVGGTLIKFDETRRAAAYAERAGRVGISVAPAQVLAVLEALDQEIPDRMKNFQLSLLSPTEQRVFWTDFWAEGFRRLGLGETEAVRFADELLDSVNGGNFQAVFDDVVPTLDGLRALGKQMGVISNFSENCETLLGSLGLAAYFDFFIVSGILGIEKPDPRIFQAAIEASGNDISELVYIGDSVYHDIEGARAVGMDAILVDRANRYANLDIVRVRDLRELVQAASG